MRNDEPLLKIQLDDNLCVIYYYIVYKNDGDLMYIGQISRHDKNKIYYRHCGHMSGKQHVDRLLRTHRFDFGILWIGFVEDVDATEKYFINFFNTMYPFGLNHQTGGNKNKQFSEDTLKKMSEKQRGEKSWRWGLKMPDWIREKQSKSLMGKKHSEESKIKCKEVAKNKKPVIQYDGHTGIKVNVYESLHEAARVVGVSTVHIKECCDGKSYQCKDFIWRWYSEYSSYDVVDVVKSPFSVKKVAQYDMNGNLIAVYNGLKEASESVGSSSGAICDVCNGKTKTSKGYVWKYV